MLDMVSKYPVWYSVGTYNSVLLIQYSVREAALLKLVKLKRHLFDILSVF
jgi:hypothetical protein